MKDAIETEKCGELTIKIFYDQDCSNPREDEHRSFLGKILYGKRSRYILGDEAVEAEEIDRIIKDTKTYIHLPVYAYIHSGVRLSTGPFGCPWDSGMSGIIYVERAEAEKEFGKLTEKNLAQVLMCLEGEVEEYSSYLEGQCYGFVIENKHGIHLDSCWGFIGDIKYCLEEARSLAKVHNKPLKGKKLNVCPDEKCGGVLQWKRAALVAYDISPKGVVSKERIKTKLQMQDRQILECIKCHKTNETDHELSKVADKLKFEAKKAS